MRARAETPRCAAGLSAHPGPAAARGGDRWIPGSLLAPEPRWMLSGSPLDPCWIPGPRRADTARPGGRGPARPSCSSSRRCPGPEGSTKAFPPHPRPGTYRIAALAGRCGGAHSAGAGTL